MKRIISTILSLAMLFSIGLTPAYAASEESVVSEIRMEADTDETAVFNENTGDQIIDLHSESVMVTDYGEEYVISDNSNPTMMDIDLSTAINVTEELLGKPTMLDEFSTESQVTPASSAVPAALPENQPPVDNSEFLLLNPESLKDGQFTTDSLLLLVTRYNNVDLCYDPDGTDFYFITNSDFPTGYYTYVSSSDGSLAGYLFHIFNAGYQLFAYAFIDIYGGKSETVVIGLDIKSRGTFEVVDGELDSVTDTDQIKITVDYSIADEYCLGILRLGTGGASGTVYYEDGTTIAGYIGVEGPSYGQTVNQSTTLKRPDGVTGEYTFIVKMRTSESDYVEGDTKYRIALGESSQQYYFFEDISNCMELPYYKITGDYKSVVPVFNAWAATSEYGHYYKITTTGPEVVTLISNYGQYRFKILDCNSLETLYDGLYSEGINYEEYGTAYTISTELGFEAGKSYYVVVYDPNGTDFRGCYSIQVGQRRVVPGKATVTIDPQNVSANVAYTLTVNLTTPTRLAAYVDEVYYWPKAIGAPTLMMLMPESRTWTSVSLSGYKSGFDRGAALIKADGQWQFKLTFSSAKYFEGATVDIYFWYEV